MADPVSWLVIEPGWSVVGRDGSDLGSIAEVVGDSGKDIFNGLVVSPGLLKGDRYVPAERVEEIVEERVVLDLDHAEFEQLGPYDAPGPSLEIRPE